MKWRLSFIFLMAAALVLFIAEKTCHADRITRMGDRQEIVFARLISELRGTRLIFIGEDHDRMEDHWRQLKIIKALHDGGVPIAIGLEMFTAENQTALDLWVSGKMGEDEFSRIYLRDWNFPWFYYRYILDFARRHGLPLVGLNVPRDVIHKVAREGFGALTPEERRRLPSGITCNVDSAYVAMVRRAFAEHTGDDRTFLHFCEAQMLWNKAMAWRLLEYHRTHSARTIIVLAGTGHAMKPAIPREVADEAGIDYRVILQENQVFNRNTLSADDADYLMGK